MDTTSGKRIEVNKLGVVRCGKFNGLLVPLDDCTGCEHHKDIEMIQDAVNGRLPVNDVICTLPTRKRIEYVITPVKEEVNGSSE